MNIQHEEIDGVRYYPVDGYSLASVTSILKYAQSNLKAKILEKWKAKLHSEHLPKIAANKINIAQLTGKAVHKFVEDFLNGEMSEAQLNRTLAKHYLPCLNKIEEVIALESCLYNSDLGYAGRTDGIIRIDGKNLIVDWKTSNRRLYQSSLNDYLVQVSAYLKAYEAMTGVRLDGVLIGVVYKKPQTKKNIRVEYFQYSYEDCEPYWNQFLDKLDYFHDNHTTNF